MGRRGGCATAAAQRANELEARLAELEEALDGVSESSQAELARLKKCVDAERNKTMTLVDDLDAARDENEQLAETLATATGERRHDAENLQKLADALAASNAERQQLHGNLKQLAEGLVAARAAERRELEQNRADVRDRRVVRYGPRRLPSKG